MLYIEMIADNGLLFLTSLTVIILFYYTRETCLLREESQKQTQSQLTPYISLRNLKEGATFSNLGKGIALHVQVDVSVQVESRPILLMPSIGAGEGRQLYYIPQDGAGAVTFFARKLPDKVSVTYFDIVGNKYTASFDKDSSGYAVFKEVSQGPIK